jgi:hypothetical protein
LGLCAFAQPQVSTEILAQGQGEPVKLGDHVAVAYRLTLPDGELVDSTPPDRSFKLEIGSSGVIPGLSQGLVGMKRGETRRITVPPELGYGATKVGPIPANSTLIFEVQLLYLQEPVAGLDEDGEEGHHYSAEEFGEDGSRNRPDANATDRPAVMEYLTRDFFSRPWRFNDAPRTLWKGNAVLTVLALAAAVLAALREGGRRSA